MTADRIPIVSTTSNRAALPIEQPGIESWLLRAMSAFICVLVLLVAAGVSPRIMAALLAVGSIGIVALCRMATLRAVEPRVRTSWQWFTVMMGFFGGWCVAVAIAGEPMASSFKNFTELSRYFNVGAYVSLALALANSVRVPRRLVTRIFLDTGVVLAGVIVIVGFVLSYSSIRVSGSELTNQLIYIWLVDLACLSLALLTLASLPRSAPLATPLVYASVAIGILCVGHFGTAVAALRLSATAPGWVYLCYGIAGWVIGLMAYRFVRGAREGYKAHSTIPATPNPVTHSLWLHLGHAVVPYAIAMCAAVLLLTHALNPDSPGYTRQFAILGAVGFMFVVGLRHVISYTENRKLYANLSELNRGLEDQIAQRTMELSRRNEELEAVHEVALVSSASLDLVLILQAVAEQLSHVMGAARCLIYDRGDGDVPTTLIVRYEHGRKQVDIRYEQPPNTLRNMRRECFDPIGHRSLVIVRQGLDPRSPEAHLLDFHGAAVGMLVPLVAGEQMVGMAELFGDDPGQIGEHQASLAEAIATQAALAVENARAYDQARFAADHDPVTGLLNHRALHDELMRLFARAVQRSSTLTVVMMDLNLFKEFNDRYGHQAGDQVLADIGRTIKQSMPTTAVVARYGGDEFTVGIPDSARENAQIFIAAIRERVDAVQDRHGFVGEGFGVSIGLASYPEDGTALPEILAAADRAMYRDKWRLKGYSDRRRDRVEAATIVVQEPVDAVGEANL